MPFDPTLPSAGSKLESAVVRAQLNALKELIDAVPAGPPGPQGGPGPQGSAGEVTTTQLNEAVANALAQTSSNTNPVPTLDTPFSNDPPTPADLEALRAKVNELILALRR